MDKTNRLIQAPLGRRDFVRISTGLCFSVSIPALARHTLGNKIKATKIGLISDLHYDLIYDGKHRLDHFVEHIHQSHVDGIAQLGDFAYPDVKNKEVINLFNEAHPTRLHVIGNHDTDAGYTKQQCLDRWGMPDRYYAQNINGIWFIILDGNDKDSPTHKGGYPAYINSEQTNWLKAKLKVLDGPVIIVSHQPLTGWLAIDNAPEIQNILAAASDKVLLAINGHTHIDQLTYVKDIPYLTINSASYYWVGDKYKHESYPAEIHQSHEWLSRTCPYQDPLYTIMTIDPATFSIHIDSKQSGWVGLSPAALGYRDESDALKVGKEITPCITARNITFTKR